MPGQVNANYSANFQKFVDFANKAYGPNGKGDDTVVRLSGMPKGDYKGVFASFARTAEMKTANDQVRDLFRIALSHCAASEEAVNYVAANIDRILVSGRGTLRTLEEVRGISLAVAANFAEHGNAGHVLDDLAGSHRIEP